MALCAAKFGSITAAAPQTNDLEFRLNDGRGDVNLATLWLSKPTEMLVHEFDGFRGPGGALLRAKPCGHPRSVSQHGCLARTSSTKRELAQVVIVLQSLM